MMTIELTKDEALSLRNLLDVAVRHEGMRAAIFAGWGGLFWATSLEKIIGGVIAIISLRPGGWMQQSAVPRCAILSAGSTGGIGQ
jgi:hypothetical protein